MNNETLNTYTLYINLSLAILQFLSLIALVVYVIKTWQIASATKKSTEISTATLEQIQRTREAETAPYVVSYFDINREKDLLYIVIKNIGKSIAKDVKLQFNPQLRNTEGEDLAKTSFVQNGVGTIPPGHEIRIALDNALHYFNTSVALKGQPPLTYYVKVSYLAETKPDRTTLDMVMDLTPFVGFRL